MDYRCPYCRTELRKRKIARAVVIRMEIDCPHCGRTIALNVHPLEEKVVVASFVAFVALAAIGFWLKNDWVIGAALVSGAVGALAWPIVEERFFPDWPRYVRPDERRPSPGAR